LEYPNLQERRDVALKMPVKVITKAQKGVGRKENTS